MLLAAGSTCWATLVSFPGSERVDGSCGTSAFAEAGATTGLDVDWDGDCGVETGMGVGDRSCGERASLL